MANPCIFSIFMKNVDQKTTEYQRKVVDKFNKTNIPHISVLSDSSHGRTMDALVEMSKDKYDAIMFLDIDAVPVDDNALSYMFERAYNGVLIGDAQRSNHIHNNQHVFCAAHNITFSLDVYEKLGKPSFEVTHRGDVAEELTFKAEENNIPVEILMPIKFDAPPIRMAWEPKNLPPHWDLADGMPKYGIGTTFGFSDDSGSAHDLFWHNYQIFQPGQQERFWKKCEELLNG